MKEKSNEQQVNRPRRPWLLLVASCLSSIPIVLFLAFAIVVSCRYCSGNVLIYYPYVTVPLSLVVVFQLVKVELGLWQGRNWARRWIIGFAIVWVLAIIGSLLTGKVGGSSHVIMIIVLACIISRLIPAILLILPSVRSWFKITSEDDD